MRLLKNYGNKNTQTKKLIISTMSKKTNLIEIEDGDEVSKKLMQSKGLCKETEKRRKWSVLIFRKTCIKCVSYLSRDCVY